MAIILSRTHERARYVWSRDPAVEPEYVSPEGISVDVIPSVLTLESDARLVGDEKPTIFVLRALNAKEVFEFLHDEEATEKLSTRLEVALTACVQVIQPDGAKVEGEALRTALTDAGDVALISAIYECARTASLRGVGRDPFRFRLGMGEQ